MSDPSVATKTCPECGTENIATAVTCGNDDCTHIFAGDEGAVAAAPAAEIATVEEAIPAAEEPLTSAAEPEPLKSPAPPMAESAAPVMAATEPVTTPPPAVEAPTIQPPPSPMPPAGAAPSTVAPLDMTSPPPYSPPPPMEQRLGGSLPSGKSKVAAGLFAILLGWAGAHQFYLGKIGLGFAFLGVSLVVGFCTGGIATGVVSVIGLVQGIMYLTATDADFERKYVIEGKFF